MRHHGHGLRNLVQVALNPGANPENDTYYDIADLLCTAEDYFDDFR